MNKFKLTIEIALNENDEVDIKPHKSMDEKSSLYFYIFSEEFVALVCGDLKLKAHMANKIANLKEELLNHKGDS